MDRRGRAPPWSNPPCSPHTRGWTGFLAEPSQLHLRVPRTRGDGPDRFLVRAMDRRCSPHTRGWTGAADCRTREGLGVPRTRGDGPESARVVVGAGEVFPAHAGMDRNSGWGERAVSACSPHTRGWTGPSVGRHPEALRVPRTRGDGPIAVPGHINLMKSVPRTRGDGPKPAPSVGHALTCSPHTRGWTEFQWPASLGSQRVPRTRGDGPRGTAR